MIEITVSPLRVERVRFIADSDLEEELLLAAWPVIRRLVTRIDRKLRRVGEGALLNLRAEQEAAAEVDK